MADVNSQEGTLTDDDAVAAILAGAGVQDEDQTPEEAEAEFEDVEEAEEVEETLEADESEEVEDDDATVEDDDTEENIDEDELKKGYLRQTDYTQKTQALAQERQQLATERQQFEAQAQQQLDQLRKAVEVYSVPTEAEPNWPELARTKKPEEYNAIQADWRDKQAKAQEANALHQRMAEVSHEQTRQRETALLLDRVPEWKDQSVFEAESAEIEAVAGEYGFAKEEVAGITDHRMVLALRELALSKRAAKAATQKRAKPARKVNAGASPSKVDPSEKIKRDLTARLKDTGNVDDAAALLLARATR